MKVIVLTADLTISKMTEKLLKQMHQENLTINDFEKVRIINSVESTLEMLDLSISAVAKHELINQACELAKKLLAKESTREVKSAMELILFEELTEDDKINHIFNSINDKVETVGEVAEKTQVTINRISESYRKIKPIFSVAAKLVTVFKIFKK